MCLRGEAMACISASHYQPAQHAKVIGCFTQLFIKTTNSLSQMLIFHLQQRTQKSLVGDEVLN